MPDKKKFWQIVCWQFVAVFSVNFCYCWMARDTWKLQFWCYLL